VGFIRKQAGLEIHPSISTDHRIGLNTWLHFCCGLTEADNRLLIAYMTTLTITDAKKNLGKWLTAAVRGEDIGILAGATVVALRPVEVEATDYAWREYGLTPAELDTFITVDNARIEKMRREGKFITLPNKLEEALEKIAGHRSRRAKAPSRAAKRAVRRGRAKAA
jgi:antitoxin (DNA-binding transcriptional repressor) of toxin-antitoxin stability system